MSGISAADVKKLRSQTGAGMMDCKKALEETSGNFDEALEYLRKKGIAKASKKADRVAAEGLVGVFVKDNKGTLVELNSETDFVSRNEDFQGFLREVGENSIDTNAFAGLSMVTLPSTGKSVKDSLTDLIARIGENMDLRRFGRLEVSDGAVVGYVHNATADQLGKIGVLISLAFDSGDLSEDQVSQVKMTAKQIAMHVAAVNPLALKIEDLDPAVVEKEREILKEQALNSGKPAEIVDKMVEGRIRKYYQENVLLEQTFVIDGETAVKNVIENLAKEVGVEVSMTGYKRFELGEGVEKETKDFAAEVAEQLKTG